MKGLMAASLAVDAVGAGIGMPGAVEAATSQGRYFQNATGFCQPSMPVYDGNIRKRPTAVANEGTGNAFVSCSMPTSSEMSSGIVNLYLALYNRGTAAVDVTCNLVHSYQAGSQVFPRTLPISPGSRTFFSWLRVDVTAQPSLQFANFNCNLPPGVEIGYGYYHYDYEIGN